MQFLSVTSPSPYRIRLVTDVAPDLTASDYVLTRLDGTSSGASVSLVFLDQTGATAVQLVVANGPLVDGAVYVLALPGQPGAPFAQVGYRQVLNQIETPVFPDEDPEAEAFGVDIDWLADALAPNGDTPTFRGKQCLTNDLAIIAMTNKGEVFHRPDAGAGLVLDVNGPMTPQNIGVVTAAVAREWGRDPRVRRNGVTLVPSQNATTGQFTLLGTVVPVALDDPTIVKLPGGGS